MYILAQCKKKKESRVLKCQIPRIWALGVKTFPSNHTPGSDHGRQHQLSVAPSPSGLGRPVRNSGWTMLGMLGYWLLVTRETHTMGTCEHLSQSSRRALFLYLGSRRCSFGISLVAQWLRLHASSAGGVGSIPGWGTKIPHSVWHGQKKKKNYNKEV